MKKCLDIQSGSKRQACNGTVSITHDNELGTLSVYRYRDCIRIRLNILS